MWRSNLLWFTFLARWVVPSGRDGSKGIIEEERAVRLLPLIQGLGRKM